MRVLVTGAGGFLGTAITRQLLERGDEVIAVQRSRYPHLDRMGVPSIPLDLTTDLPKIIDAVKGCDVVIHAAAKAGVWGPYETYRQANVQATNLLISACKQAGVRNMVYTSSPSVVFDGKDESGIDESAPYPEKYLTAYPQTKALAERAILKANASGELVTTALRPHLIWGPGDRHLVPRILSRSKLGKLKLVGDGSNRVDSTYIDNAAHAHILAADLLYQQGHRSACAGKAYFISNGEPMPMRELINRILIAGGQPRVSKTVSPQLAYLVGSIMEKWYHTRNKLEEPIMTRFVARQLSTDHWFDISAAKRDLGYEPLVKIDEGMERLAEDLKLQI
ncbi:MAG: 3-beta hydroxysteroid dehydrogenase [Phycisphaeraceae bacterium]|nr:3-beta hydroxysteroid dehydrogenase [Phycisphaeraceae bacterium]